MEVGLATYNEVARKLREADYQHCFVEEDDDGVVLVMQGIALKLADKACLEYSAPPTLPVAASAAQLAEHRLIVLGMVTTWLEGQMKGHSDSRTVPDELVELALILAQA